ncbi:amino acid ABC transporter ATP-binding protein, partial [bacterium]
MPRGTGDRRWRDRGRSIDHSLGGYRHRADLYRRLPVDVPAVPGPGGLTQVAEETQPKIEVRDLHYSVGDLEILKGITLSIAPAEILCIMGLSGGGKSTLIRNIAGLARPSSGEIVIDGVETAHLVED